MITEALTQDEIETIGSFIGTLDDRGIQAILTTRVVQFVDGGEIAAKAFGVALEDLGDTCEVSRGQVMKPEAVIEAAQSLALIASVARVKTATIRFDFPEGFVPSDELVQKCVRIFFASLQETAAAE